jgi:hypothetical protein
VLLIGGGHATLITGYLALGHRIPLATVATFGSAARRIWKANCPQLQLETLGGQIRSICAVRVSRACRRRRAAMVASVIGVEVC